MFIALMALGLFAALALMLGAAGQRDNFSGDIHVAAPSGGVVIGGVYAIGNTAVMVARETQAQTVSALFAQRGQIWANKLSTDTFAVGDKVYADLTNHRLTSTSTSNTLVGIALAVAASGDATMFVDLQPIAPTST